MFSLLKASNFDDVAGEDEAKENLAEIVDYLHNPKKYTDAGASMPKGLLLVGLLELVKQCLQRLLPVNLVFLSSQFPVRNLLKCLLVWVLLKSAIFLNRQRKNAPCIVFIDEIDAIGKNVMVRWAEMMSASRH